MVFVNWLIPVLFFYVFEIGGLREKQILRAESASINFRDQLKLKDHGLGDFRIQLNFFINQYMGTVEGNFPIMIILDMLPRSGVVWEEILGTTAFNEFQFLIVYLFQIFVILFLHSGSSDGSVGDAVWCVPEGMSS